MSLSKGSTLTTPQKRSNLILRRLQCRKPDSTIKKEQLDLEKAVKQENAEGSNDSSIGFNGQDSAEECFPTGD